MTRNPLPRGQVGIADLARVFAIDGPELQRFVAGLLGYEIVDAPPEFAKMIEQQEAWSIGPLPQEPTVPPNPWFVPVSEYPAVPFWYAHSFKIEPREASPDRRRETAGRALVDENSPPCPKGAVPSAGERRGCTNDAPKRQPVAGVWDGTRRRSDRRPLGPRAVHGDDAETDAQDVGTVDSGGRGPFAATRPLQGRPKTHC